MRGVYKYDHVTREPFDIACMGPPERLLRCAQVMGAPSTMLGAERMWDRWGKDGSLVFPGAMVWWEAHKISPIFDQEFQMYDWHLRKIGGRSNFGWLRNMFHSLAQQVMRQDAAYWMLYASLRPDVEHKLISYPYYAKFTKPGDSTYFRHIDVNVPLCIRDGRGKSAIQGSVSLDDETDSNCTQILPGLHRHLKEWWQDCVVARGLETNDYVHRIVDRMWKKQDAERFETDWTDVKCKAFDIRIADPRLPHGSRGPADSVRRTMLPWFVGIMDDHRTLDMTEAGTWEQVLVLRARGRRFWGGSKCGPPTWPVHVTWRWPEPYREYRWFI